MTYSLTLTQGERVAFDWVGDRYATGGGIHSLLSDCLKEDESWDDDGDLIFNVPEYVAWSLAELADSEDGLWPCFSDFLAKKMQRFVSSIV